MVRLLSDKPFIAPVTSTYLGGVVDRLMQRYNAQPPVVATVHAHQLALDLVKRSLGFTLMDSITVHALLTGPDHDKVAVYPLIRKKKYRLRLFSPVAGAFQTLHDILCKPSQRQ